MKTKKYNCYAIKATSDEALEGYLVLTAIPGDATPLLFISKKAAAAKLNVYRKIVKDKLSVVPVLVSVQLAVTKKK